MTFADFDFRDIYYSFEIQGHTGVSKKGDDIVCAAISAVTMFVVNTITESLKLKANAESDEETVSVRFKLKEDDAYARTMLESFANEIKEIEGEYPDNVRVTIQK